MQLIRRSTHVYLWVFTCFVNTIAAYCIAFRSSGRSHHYLPSPIHVQVQSMDHSCIVFDTAPTGHTLRLLQFPSTLEKGLAKLQSLRNSFGGMIEQVGSMLGGPQAAEIQETLVTKLDSLKVCLHGVVAWCCCCTLADVVPGLTYALCCVLCLLAFLCATPRVPTPRVPTPRVPPPRVPTSTPRTSWRRSTGSLKTRI